MRVLRVLFAVPLLGALVCHVPSDLGGGSETGDGDGDGDFCLQSFTPTYTPPNLMFLADASSSMVVNPWDHDADAMTPDVARWSSLHAVVEATIANFQDFVQAGIQRFPSADACPDATPQSDNCYDENACNTAAMPEVSLAPSNAAAILAGIPGPAADNVEIVGATPTGRAFDSARTHLLAQPPGPARHILLLTDGAPNCDSALSMPHLLELYDETLLAKVESAYLDDDITTTVFGIGIYDNLQGNGPDGEAVANPYARLDEIAEAGGSQFHNAVHQAQLLAVITGVLDEIANCHVDLGMSPIGLPEPIQMNHVWVESSEGFQIPHLDLDECETEDGWAWIEEGQSLTFCGSWCDAMRVGDPMLEIIYGCPPD
jgi:hypothetical protein